MLNVDFSIVDLEGDADRYVAFLIGRFGFPEKLYSMLFMVFMLGFVGSLVKGPPAYLKAVARLARGKLSYLIESYEKTRKLYGDYL